MVETYVVDLVLSLGTTYWVGQSLHGDGRVFLVNNLDGQERGGHESILIGPYESARQRWRRAAEPAR